MQGGQTVFLSASLDRKFLVGRPYSVTISVVNSMQCSTKCQPPCGIEKQERKGAVPGQEDGKERGEGREGNRGHGKRK